MALLNNIQKIRFKLFWVMLIGYVSICFFLTILLFLSTSPNSSLGVGLWLFVLNFPSSKLIGLPLSNFFKHTFTNDTFFYLNREVIALMFAGLIQYSFLGFIISVFLSYRKKNVEKKLNSEKEFYKSIKSKI